MSQKCFLTFPQIALGRHQLSGFHPAVEWSTILQCNTTRVTCWGWGDSPAQRKLLQFGYMGLVVAKKPQNVSQAAISLTLYLCPPEACAPVTKRLNPTVSQREQPFIQVDPSFWEVAISPLHDLEIWNENSPTIEQVYFLKNYVYLKFKFY